MRKILSNIKRKIDKQITYLLSFYRKRELYNRDFTIISNNCWAGFIYQRYNLKYQTPFLGLFIPAPDYVEFLENFDYYMQQKFTFINKLDSKYYSLIKCVKERNYPIVLLDNKVEIHFLHYKTKDEVIKKWNDRKLRINQNNMLVKFSEIDCCTPELIKKFDKLSFKNKICFTVNKYPDLKSVITYPDKKHIGQVFEEWKYRVPFLINLLNNLKD